jgi:hypothetical protein
MALYHRSSQRIQIASQPNSSMLALDARGDDANWCLSHLPGYHCFISHFCANPSSKQRLRVLYRLPQFDEQSYLDRGVSLPFKIDVLKFD